MTQISITDAFMRALADLDPADAKRATAFLGKLVTAPEAASLRPEIVHDAHDRSIRSLKVTHDLRAIGHIEGERLMLLHVARHDRAYKWARSHCVVCMVADGQPGLVDLAVDGGEAPLNPRSCCTQAELDELFERFGVPAGARYSARG